MDVTKPYEFRGFGAMDVTKPYEFIGFGWHKVYSVENQWFCRGPWSDPGWPEARLQYSGVVVKRLADQETRQDRARHLYHRA